jgi:hypothetical protein
MWQGYNIVASGVVITWVIAIVGMHPVFLSFIFFRVKLKYTCGAQLAKL